MKCEWYCTNPLCLHLVKKVPWTVVGLKTGCPYCAGQRLCTEDQLCEVCLPKSIRSRREELMERALEFVRGPAGETDAELFPMTGRKCFWSCKITTCKHEFDARGAEIFGPSQCGCPYCCMPPQRICPAAAGCEPCQARTMVAFPSKRRSKFVCGPAGQKAEETPLQTKSMCTWECTTEGCWHTYLQTGRLASRGKGCGCPFCSSRPKVLCPVVDDCWICLAKTIAGHLHVLARRLLEFICGPNNEVAGEIFAGSHLKCIWKCLRCLREFAAMACRVIGRHSGCPCCLYKAQTHVLEYLEERFGAGSVRPEATFPWSERRRYDFEVRVEGAERRVLVEVDGKQHFQPVEFRPGYPTDPDEQRRIDCAKAADALANGLSVVRMPTTGVIAGDTWQSELSASIRAAADGRACIVYCEEMNPGVYAEHRRELGVMMKERARAKKMKIV